MKKTSLAIAVLTIVAIVAFAAYQLIPSGPSIKEFKLFTGEYAFSMADGGENPAIRVKAGETVKVIIKNVGGRTHEFMIVENIDLAIKQVQEGKGMPMALFGAETGKVKPKEEKTITFKADRPGTYFYVCLQKDPSDPDVHAKLGMFGKFIVER